MRSCLLAFLLSLGISSTGQATSFGFDYWPRGFSSDIFFDANWVNHKAEVDNDLNAIQSMGGETLRLMFWPEQSGFQLDADADSISPQYLQMVKNFPEFLAMLSQRHMRVILCFSNSYLLYGPDQAGKTKWWNLKYGPHEKLDAFLTDSGRWITGLVQASEMSNYSSTVIYYDIQNEYSPSWQDMNTYVAAMAQLPAIPADKLGISILYGATDVGELKNLANAQQIDFRYIDFHVYPDNKSSGFNMNIEGIHRSLQANFPRASFLIGELGYRANSSDEQAAQSSEMLAVIERAQTDHIGFVLGWSLYEDSGQPKMQMGGGMGVFDSAGLPKQVVSALKARNTLARQNDPPYFEVLK